jgi:hypothetical protein
MTKEALIELITKYVPDGEEIAIGTYWTRQDVQDWQGETLTADEWERFVFWYEKHQDGSYDADEAFAFAKGKN